MRVILLLHSRHNYFQSPRNMKSEDCYIVLEDGEDGKDVHMQCVGCYEKNKKGVLWKAANGYGPWNIRCPCGHMIQVLVESDEKD